MKKVVFNIDIVSSCNLSCPSCPVGNSKNVKNSAGLMSPELLGNILAKASDECEVSYIGLFNWAEPMAHPKIVEMVEIAESYGPCHLSSNLSLRRMEFEDLLRIGPEFFRVSVSGFTQAVYSRTHRGGDVEVVKRNMAKLSEAGTKVGSNTKLEVLYHRYLGNADDELLMKEYSEALGYSFRPVWAFLMPLEKVFQYFSDSSQLSSQDIQIVDILALPLDKKTISVSRAVNSDCCTLLEDQITMNSSGVVLLCCGIFDEKRYSIGNYLELSLDEIQEKKRLQTVCQKCMNLGLHNLCTYSSPRYDKIAEKNILRYYREMIRTERESVVGRLRRRVGRIVGR